MLEKARLDDVSDPESLELVEIKPLQTNASDSSGIRLLIDGYRNYEWQRFRWHYTVRSVESTQGTVMFGFGGSVKIYYCPTPINLRKSFDGLAGAVEE